MKILFLGDVSNFHNTLAHALRSAGHECVVASMANSWQRIAGDIDISREDGILGTAKFAAKLPFLLAKMCGYDIVHFINPHFLSLKPNKLAQVLAFLKQHNRYLFYSACCTDYDYLSTCHDGSTFRYSDFLLGDKPSPYVESHEWTQHNHWDNPEVVNYHHHLPLRILRFLQESKHSSCLCGYSYRHRCFQTSIHRVRASKSALFHRHSTPKNYPQRCRPLALCSTTHH